MDYYNDFNITSNQDVSTLFTERELFTFSDAALYIKSLPYKRNSNKNDIACVLKDSYGTCSTKHALLHQLAIENMQGDFKLMMGIYKMGTKIRFSVFKVLYLIYFQAASFRVIQKAHYFTCQHMKS